MNKIIAVDFDGTLCENKWPEIGEANLKLIWNLTEQKEKYGAKIILWTCRTGEKLEEAIRFCEERGLRFDAVNENLPEVIEWMGGDTRKIYANEYLDDRAVAIRFSDEISKEGEQMSKAMLIMEMPSSCVECPCSCLVYEHNECEVLGKKITLDDKYEIRPTWCPLREAPKPKEDNLSLHIPYNEGFINGYNACIDEILGGGE